MKQVKKLVALLLTAALVLSLFPAAVFALEGEEALPTPEAPNYGLINKYHEGTTAVTDAYLRGETLEINGVSVGRPVRDLPSSWDSRTHGWVTSVKNQNPYGSCWAHAALASVEGYMIKHGVPVGAGAAATTSLNLSETQHCWFNYSYAYDAEGMLNGDKSTPQDTCLDQGGNGEMSAYTLQRWTGAADESVAALTYGNASSVNYNGLDSQYAYQYNVSHVQNSEWIPGTNVDAVKQAIMDYGAGNISYYETGYAYTYICNTGSNYANHAITLIGWDDSIAVSKFQPNRPSKPGAWLCKNSWGTSQFDNGYCWISYEDTSVLEGYIFFYDAEPIDNYQHNYQYDGTCNVVCYGKGWNNSIDYYEGFANDTKVANVFTAKGNESLRAVGFCNWDEAMTYTVEIYKNPNVGNPSSGELLASQTGFLTFSGYYTIPLENPVALSAGDTFAVVVSQNVPVADENGKYVHTPYDATFNNSDVISWASFIHANHGNTSYYKEPNGAWTDCPENGDYRIKAYTDDILFNLTAISNNEAWGTVQVDGARILASPAEGYYVESCEVLEGAAVCTIDVNTILVSASEDCTVLVNFAPKPTFTVNFMVSGTPAGSQSALIYDEITLPDSVSIDPEGWSFSGWTTRQIEETTDAPEFYAPGAAYMVTGSVTLYALFTRVEEGTGELCYELLSAAPADWTGNYVITYGTDSSLRVMKGVTVSSNGAEIENSANAAALSASGMSLNGTQLTNAANAYVFKVAASGNYYTIRSASTNVYVGETTSNYLGGYNSYVSGYCDWSLGTQTNASSATCVNGGSYPYLSFNPSSNYFWTQGSNGISNGYVYNIRWWRETQLDTTYYWTDPVAGEHDHVLEHVEAVAPGCVEGGNIEYWRCTICGKYFADAAGEEELNPDAVLVAPLGHDYVAVVTPPTPDDPGYTTHSCTRCGDSYVDSYTDPLGYDYTVSFSTPAGIAAPAPMTVNSLAGAELPSAEAPAGYSFLGWVADDYDNVRTKPAEIFTGLYKPACDLTLRALYSYELDESTPPAMTRMSTADSLAAGDRIVITAAGTGFGLYQQNSEGLSGHVQNFAFTEDVDAILEDGKRCLDVSPADNGWYLGDEENGFLHNPGANSLTVSDTDKTAWTLTVRNGCLALTANGRFLYCRTTMTNAAANQWRLIEAASSTPTSTLEIYKVTGGAAVTVCYTTVIAPPHEHSPGEPVRENEVPATCTEAGGYDTVTYCSVCGEELERVHTEIPALGHTPADPVKENERPATCTEAGAYDTVVCCAVCGAELSRAHVDTEALGHEWDEGVVTVEPTETSTGILLYTCVRCGATREEEIPVLPHDCKIAQFTDVMEAYPYGTPEHEAIEWAFTADPQVTAGTSETSFGVGKAVKRGDAMFYLWVAAGKPEPTLTTSPFTDVTDPKAYYYKAVLWAYENGITKGVSDTEFGRKKSVSRRDMMVFLYTQQGKPPFTLSESPYTDVTDPKAYYYKAVMWAWENGIDKGADGMFNGKSDCLRETVVLWMYRTLQSKALAE